MRPKKPPAAIRNGNDWLCPTYQTLWRTKTQHDEECVCLHPDPDEAINEAQLA